MSRPSPWCRGPQSQSRILNRLLQEACRDSTASTERSMRLNLYGATHCRRVTRHVSRCRRRGDRAFRTQGMQDRGGGLQLRGGWCGAGVSVGSSAREWRVRGTVMRPFGSSTFELSLELSGASSGSSSYSTDGVRASAEKSCCRLEKTPPCSPNLRVWPDSLCHEKQLVGSEERALRERIH